MGGLWWLWRWRRPFSGRGLRHWLPVWVVLLLWLGSMTARAASNVLPSPAGRLDDQVLPVDINQFKPPECAGITVTNLVVASDSGGLFNVAVGTEENDLILGTDGWDRLEGRGGDDCIVGGDGFDLLYGDAGNDVILGGAGLDYLDGGSGTDYCDGELKVNCP